MSTRARVSAERPVGDVDWRRHDAPALTPLLEAALDAFYESGFHGTSVRDIARRVGQTVPALYYHHDSKEGVLLALVAGGIRDLLWRVEAAASDGGDDVRRRFENVVEAITLHGTRRVRAAALDAESRYLSAENRAQYAALRKQVETVLAEIVDDGVASGVFRASHPGETTRAILGMLQSITRWYRTDGPDTPEEIAARYVDICLRVVGVDP
ncbi:TetR/AcrR family transcriptional regulator [Solicola sp. PLA-1-18]|uniref:TetR/AcrR family transcriptional regulator n=1 Tax=Solicola sp. PLA-1-18 TaxID=3380532 RepID=UPI003B793B77